MRVLIVEDDEAIAIPLAKGLEREGLEVDRVENGADALGIAAQSRFDVVLLDLGLPDRDGFDVCRRAAGAVATCRSSWSPRGPTKSTVSWGSSSAPTTTS